MNTYVPTFLPITTKYNEKGDSLKVIRGDQTLFSLCARKLLHPLEARAVRRATLKTKQAHCRAFFKHLVSVNYQLKNNRFDYEVVWQFATTLLDAERGAQSVTNYVGTVLNSLTLQNLINSPNAEVRERGQMLITMAAHKTPPEKARPFSVRAWNKIIKRASGEDVKRFKLWSVLGWRRTQFSDIEYANAEINPTEIRVQTPPGKGRAAGNSMPMTSIICRCDLYARSYTLTIKEQPHRCVACQTALPTWEGVIDLKAVEEGGFHSHSFRRTLSLAIKICIKMFDIKIDDALAQRINGRLQWFEGDSLRPAKHLDMLTHYAVDHTEFHWDFFPACFRQAALEICAPPGALMIASPNGTPMLM